MTRFTSGDSNQYSQCKIMAIIFLVNRRVKFTLNKEKFYKELQLIKNVVLYKSISSAHSKKSTSTT